MIIWNKQLVFTCYDVIEYILVSGTSLVVQWSGLHAFNAKGLGKSVVGELRCCKPWGMTKNNNNNFLKESIHTGL